MIDTFWNKVCKDKGVVTKTEIENMKQLIQVLLKEIEDRKELITIFSQNSTTLNQRHIVRHEKRIVEAEQQIEKIAEKIQNSKKEFDK